MGSRNYFIKTLRDYLVRQVVFPFATISLLLTFVFFVIGTLGKISDLIITKGVDAYIALKLLFYSSSFVISYTLPIGLLCAVVLVYNRLSADNEIDAIKASGGSKRVLILPILALALLLSFLLLYLNSELVPESHYKVRKIIKNVALKTPTAYIEEGTFIEAFPGYIMFVYRINGSHLKQVRLYKPSEDKPPKTIIAEEGELIADKQAQKVKLLLKNVISTEQDENDPTKLYKIESQNMIMSFDVAKNKPMEKKLKEHTIRELYSLAERYKKQGIDITPIKAELHRKYALSFSPFFLSLAGLSIALLYKIRHKSASFVLALLITLGYYVILVLTEGIISNKPQLYLLYWMPNIVSLVISFLTLRLST